MLARDTSTGLNLAVERVENPGTGRWDSQDPLGFGALDTNLYRYTYNDSPGLNDPSGEIVPILIGIGVVGLILFFPTQTDYPDNGGAMVGGGLGIAAGRLGLGGVIWGGKQLFGPGAQIPQLPVGPPGQMLGGAIKLLKSLPRNARLRADTFEGLARQIETASRYQWRANRGLGTDGSHIFLGRQGEGLVIAPNGCLYRHPEGTEAGLQDPQTT
jgi:RHS repeat-associated protein